MASCARAARAVGNASTYATRRHAKSRGTLLKGMGGVRSWKADREMIIDYRLPYKVKAARSSKFLNARPITNNDRR